MTSADNLFFFLLYLKLYILPPYVQCVFKNISSYYLCIENAEGYVLIAVYLYACVLFA